MNLDLINKKYWEELPAKEIIGRNALPGNELTNVLLPGSSILDLGCGTGEMAEFLSAKGYEVTGMDLNVDAINQNRLKKTKVKYICGDVTKPLPFAAKSFNAIVISFLLVNIIPLARREKLVLEMTRVLKTNGHIWLNEGLLSDDYADRYKLSKPFVDDESTFFVFKKNSLSSSIKTVDQLNQAIKGKDIARLAHHFTLGELKNLFHDYFVVYQNESQTISPNTKFKIKMIVMVLQHH